MRLFRLSAVATALAAFAANAAEAQAIQPTPVSVASFVEITRGTIRLCDLLPPQTAARLREAAAGIELGKAPPPGGMRVFDGGEIAERLSGNPELLRQIRFPALITVERKGWPIRGQPLRAAISSFLAARGWAASDWPNSSSLEWPASIASAEPDPKLEVAGARRDLGRRGLQLRVRCVQRALCGSFLVRTRLPQAPSGQAGLRLPNLLAAAESDRGKSPTKALITQPAIRPGDAATLVLASGGIRVSLPVVCLQRGAVGEKVRARAKADSRVYTAEVVDGKSLRAAF